MLDRDDLLGTVALGVADLVAKTHVSSQFRQCKNSSPVVAVLYTTVHRNAGISKAVDVVIGILRPLGDHVGALRLVVEVIADGILLVDVALEVDIGPGRHEIIGKANEIDTEAAGTELLLEIDIGELRVGLVEDFDGGLEVIKVALVGSLGEHSPSFSFGHVGNAVHVDLHLILAVDSLMTLLLAHLANLRLFGTVAGSMTFLVALVTSAGELARLRAVGFGMTFFTLTWGQA